MGCTTFAKRWCRVLWYRVLWLMCTSTARAFNTRQHTTCVSRYQTRHKTTEVSSLSIAAHGAIGISCSLYQPCHPLCQPPRPRTGTAHQEHSRISPRAKSMECSHLHTSAVVSIRVPRGTATEQSHPPRVDPRRHYGAITHVGDKIGSTCNSRHYGQYDCLGRRSAVRRGCIHRPGSPSGIH